jgi:hypothetical protein
MDLNYPIWHKVCVVRVLAHHHIALYNKPSTQSCGSFVVLVLTYIKIRLLSFLIIHPKKSPSCHAFWAGNPEYKSLDEVPAEACTIILSD